MKAAAAIFCLTPWICFAFFKFTESVGASGNLIFPFLVAWCAISPIVTAIGLFVAYKEGIWNVET